MVNLTSTESLLADQTAFVWESAILRDGSNLSQTSSLTRLASTQSIPDTAGNRLLNANPLGPLKHLQATQATDWVGTADLNDYYAFTLLGQSNLSLSLTGLGSDAALALVSRTGEVIQQSNFPGSAPEVINLSGLQAGEYYVRVYAFAGDTPYNLSLTTAYTRVDGTVQNRGPLPWDRVETRPVNIRVADKAIDRTIDNTETWVVIHGHRSAPDGFMGELAQAIGRSEQVIVLDWSAPANNSVLRPDLSARWIQEVATFAAQTLRNVWGIATSNLNFIGHSLGTYVASEIGSIFTGPQRQDPQINQIVALDPARSSTLTGYDINGLKSGFQAIAEFNQVSTFARAFWGDGLPVPGRGGEGLGSERYARTADESFRIEFEASDDAIENHNQIVKLFTNMIGNLVNPISRLFQLDNGKQPYWEVSTEDEGVLIVDAQNQPKSLYFLTPITRWSGAQSLAVAAGGNLVTINDAAEQAWIESRFDVEQNLWIGLTDSPLYGAIEGVFRWVSGQAVTYTNWSSGEPNNASANPEGEDFVELYPNGKWNDVSDPFTPLRGLVEVSGSVSPPLPIPTSIGN